MMVKRNQAIECARLTASIFVVFIHFLFPESLGFAMESIARFAVPFFFIISGYFSYGSNPETIRHRLIGVTKLNVLATGLYFLWGSYRVFITNQDWVQWIGSMFSVRNISMWLFVQANPFMDHLWYLSAMMFCYFALYIYMLWEKDAKCYRYFYIAGFFLFLIQVAISTFNAVTWGQTSCYIYRNATLFGLPMVALGLFLREYYERVVDTYGLTTFKLWLLIMAGICFTLIQRFGIGENDLPMGSLFSAIALVLLTVKTPQITNNRVLSNIISKFGHLSTYIYVTHMFWQQVYATFFEEQVSAYLNSTLYYYLMPLIVVVITLSTGIAWEIIRSLASKCFVSRKRIPSA